MIDVLVKALIGLFSISAIVFGYIRWRRSGVREELLWSLLGLLSRGVFCFDVTTQYLLGQEIDHSFFWMRQFLDTLVLVFCMFLGWKFYFAREQ
jgi:hypothetical protein